MTWDRVRKATSRDGDMRMLEEMATDSYPPDSRAGVPADLRIFYQYREDIMSIDGVVLYGDKLVIPPFLCCKVLAALYAAHQPCMPAAAPTPSITPVHPFQAICADFFNAQRYALPSHCRPLL